MEIRLFTDAIKRRRNTYKECEYLSDWQVHSAHLAAGSISSLACGFEQGPIYLPMPTGSGKTTGAIWGIVEFVKEYPDKKICFLTPYQDSVDQVYKQLLDYLGDEVVGYYHSAGAMNKVIALQKQVLVISHAFVEYNHGKLDDRDLFVVDEAIYATGEAQLKLEHFSKIRSWATTHGIMVNEFQQLLDLVIDLDGKLRATGKNYIAVPNDLDFEWAKQISEDLKFEDHSQTIDVKLFNGAQRFCEALTKGLVFLSKGKTSQDKYDPVYSAAVLGIPRLDKTVILSATGGMVYNIAGPFKQDSGVRDYWTGPTFEKLKLVQLSGPEMTGYYNSWSSSKNKEKVVTYLDWLLKTIPESEIYLTVPKKVLVGCLPEYLNLPRHGEIEYPIAFHKHGKNVKVSHHARSVGANEFRNCDAVIYLWDNHLPQSTAIQKFHTLEDEPITDEALESANSGQLIGDYKRIKEAQFIDNMMQQIGRGKVRNIDNQAVAGEMTAYVLTGKAERFTNLRVQYKGCQVQQLAYQNNSVKKLTGQVAQVIEFLASYESNKDISAKIVEQALGFNLRRHSKVLTDNPFIEKAGYTYVKGERGSGNSATFKWNG
jgi:hypothetical protein